MSYYRSLPYTYPRKMNILRYLKSSKLLKSLLYYYYKKQLVWPNKYQLKETAHLQIKQHGIVLIGLIYCIQLLHDLSEDPFARFNLLSLRIVLGQIKLEQLGDHEWFSALLFVSQIASYFWIDLLQETLISFHSMLWLEWLHELTAFNCRFIRKFIVKRVQFLLQQSTRCILGNKWLFLWVLSMCYVAERQKLLVLLDKTLDRFVWHFVI